MQVGLALLLIALDVASTLLVLGIIATVIGRVRALGHRLDRTTLALSAEGIGLDRRFTAARSLLTETAERVTEARSRFDKTGA